MEMSERNIKQVTGFQPPGLSSHGLAQFPCINTPDLESEALDNGYGDGSGVVEKKNMKQQSVSGQQD